MTFIRNIIVLLLLLLPFQLQADSIRVAVASNFTHAMQELKQQFEQQSEHSVELISGSTGKIYAQIINGAPFDAFFAADIERPQRLEQANRIQPGSRFSYALGQLVLWSPQPDLVDDHAGVLQSGGFRHLAMANPKLAPYGKAAQQVLEANSVWQRWQHHIVRGENIGQTYQYVKSGNAELGFIALSQLKAQQTSHHGSQWLVPEEVYDPIEQQAVQLTDNAATTAFMAFIKTNSARRLIDRYGYLAP